MRRRELKQAGVILVCILLFGACKQAVAPPVEQEYRVMQIATSDKKVSTTYSASVRGKQDIDIYPQVSGFITKLNVEEGSTVRKGQILFVIDQVPYQAALATAKANTEAARMAVSTTQLTYNSKKELFENNVVSEYDLKTSQNAHHTALAQLAQMEALELSARNNLSYTEVKSPSDGVIGTLPFRVGALVGPSIQKPLTTISDNSVMYAYFSMNETQLLSLVKDRGSKEELMKSLPEVDLKLGDNTIYPEKGKIESISGLIDRTTGTVTLRAAFENVNKLLFSGSSANVILPVQMNGVISIPKSATFEIQDRVYVYLVSDGKTKSQPVEVIPIDGGKEYIVTQGLTDGDTIVAEGVGLLREGVAIKVKQ